MDALDFTLRCNSLKCRVTLNDRAVVTTCSHVFCTRCAESLGLISSAENARQCPACKANLANADDVCISVLNPTEDYKTSVLSGLSPSIIMECATRALSFYTYQTTQEVVYQGYLAKTLTEKCNTLNGQMDKIIHDANAEIVNLREKLQAAYNANKGLEVKNNKLTEAYQEKHKAHAEQKKLYDTLKASVMHRGVANAASRNAESALNAATGNLYDHRTNTGRTGYSPNQLHFTADLNRNAYTHERQPSGENHGGGTALRDLGPRWNKQAPGIQMRGYSSQSASMATPSQRQPLPFVGNRNVGYTDAQHGQLVSEGPIRRPAADPNAYNSISGYGMSSGMKVGRQPISRSPRNTMAQPTNLSFP